MSAQNVPATVRISGPPNSSFLVGYPGISATLVSSLSPSLLPLVACGYASGSMFARGFAVAASSFSRHLADMAVQPRIVGKVEIRPGAGFSAPVNISMVRICLQRRETIHPAAENVAKRHLGTPRRETVDLVGKEVLLFRCVSGKEAESVIAMDLPFQIFIPFGRGGEETNRRIPPASLQLPSRTAETYYELVVTVQQGSSMQNRYTFPIPLQRYDTLSTFGMYNRPETKAATADHIVTLGISLPKWSYGPLDPITVYVKLTPNPDYLNKAKRVTIQKLTLTIEEEITFNPEGDEPTKKVNKIAKHTQPVGTKMPEAGYITNLGLVLPARDLRDPDGIIKRGKPAFPMYEVTSFSTSSTLYKIEFFLSIKVSLLVPPSKLVTVLLTGPRHT